MSSDLENCSNPKILKLPKMGKVVLSLNNCLLPESKLTLTPSQVDNLDPETEYDLRVVGCELIQTAGILLRLPQVAMATGQVLFQRFYYSKSFVRYPMETTAMGCLCLASKIEESPRRIRDVINVVHHIKQVKGGKKIQPMILDGNYISQKNEVIKSERRVLKELGFCVHVKHPHKVIVVFLQFLGYEKHKKLSQLSWNYMNDALRTDVFMRYHPETIATACICLSARFLNIPLPRSPTWYSIFGIKEEDILPVFQRILRLYKRKKVNIDELEKRVEELRKAYQELRLKNLNAKAHTNNNSNVNGQASNPTSRLSSPNENNNGSSQTHKNSKSTDSNNHSRHGRKRSRTRSRSRSPSEKSRKRHHKKHHRSRNHHKKSHKRLYSKSLSLSPERRNMRKTHRLHSRTRSRSIDRSRDYEKHDYHHYDRYKSKHRDDRSYKADRR